MSRDLREYARKTNVKLLVGAMLLLFVVGLGLIYLVYGKGAAGLGFLCLLAGLVPIALIIVVLFFLDRIVNSAGRE